MYGTINYHNNDLDKLDNSVSDNNQKIIELENSIEQSSNSSNVKYDQESDYLYVLYNDIWTKALYIGLSKLYLHSSTYINAGEFVVTTNSETYCQITIGAEIYLESTPYAGLAKNINLKSKLINFSLYNKLYLDFKGTVNTEATLYNSDNFKDSVNLNILDIDSEILKQKTKLLSTTRTILEYDISDIDEEGYVEIASSVLGHIFEMTIWEMYLK